jgi:hypothetical protein
MRRSRTESEATLQRADRQEETQRHQTVLESHLVAQNTYITTQRSQEILCDQETTLVNLQAGQNQLLRKVEEQVLKTSGLLNGLQEIMAG